MLELYDADTGAVTPVVPVRSGQLRTYTVGAVESERGAAGVRAYLLADLVRRVGEMHRLSVGAWHGGAALPGEWEALNIHPLAAAAELPEPLDIGIGARPAGAGGRWLQGGPVEPSGTPELDAAAAGLGGSVQPGDAGEPGGPGAGPSGGSYAAAVAARGLDPLALRLALLQRHYREPVTLTWDELAVADGLLAEWRRQVALWANSPSKPMCAQYTGDIKAAFDTDLDVPAALRILGELAADAEIPAGSKFETFASLDHLLGLDLARDIGRF